MVKRFPLPARRIDAHNHLNNDPDGSGMIAIMDRNNVDMTVIMGFAGKPDSNETCLAGLKKYPKRFVAGCYVDPRDGKAAIETIRRYHGEGFKIVKLFPNLGYYPDDPALTRFWDAVAKLGMAVLSHCGWLGGSGAKMNQEPWAAYYSHPGRFEKVIRRHPETIFIMAHMGGIAGWFETIMLTTRTPNTYVDCSPGQGLLVLEKGGPMASAVPPEKLLFGADSRDLDTLIPRYQKALINLDYGPHLEEIFYSNACGILEKLGVAVTPKPAGAMKAPGRKTR